jgi:hypothetical protein
MRFILITVILGILSCNHLTADKLSYWETQKNDFKYRNKTEFVANNEVRYNLKTFKKISLHLLPWIDTVYLYSWQDRDPTKNEFTVIGNEGKYGLSVFYLIFNKKDSLISSTRIAGANDQGDYWINFRSVFFSKDSLYVINTYTKNPYSDVFPKDKPQTSDSTLHVIEKDGNISVNIRDSKIENE